MLQVRKGQEGCKWGHLKEEPLSRGPETAWREARGPAQQTWRHLQAAEAHLLSTQQGCWGPGRPQAASIRGRGALSRWPSPQSSHLSMISVTVMEGLYIAPKKRVSLILKGLEDGWGGRDRKSNGPLRSFWQKVPLTTSCLLQANSASW